LILETTTIGEPYGEDTQAAALAAVFITNQSGVIFLPRMNPRCVISVMIYCVEVNYTSLDSTVLILRG
jgi:hypothetical protein